MSFFISNAWAQAPTPPSATGPGMELFVMVGIFFLIMYFLIIRPQNKKNKEHKTLLASLAKGDEVVTNGGLLGKIDDIDDNFIALEICANTIIKVQKQFITTVMPKGTITKEKN